MEGLPPEMFVEILSKLDSVSLVRARSICVTWRDFCDILIERRIELQRDNDGFCAHCLKPLIYQEMYDCDWIDCEKNYCDTCYLNLRACFNCGGCYCDLHPKLTDPQSECNYCSDCHL